jgi:serine/threonine-protein kinase HipA
MSSTNNCLNIYIDQQKIAELHLENERLSWIYTKKWQQDGFSVSPHLPIDNNFNAVNTQIFLRNMLPVDGGQKLRINGAGPSLNNPTPVMYAA